MTSLLVVRPGPLAWAKEVRITLVILSHQAKDRDRHDRGASPLSGGSRSLAALGMTSFYTGGLGPFRGRVAPCAPPRNCVRGVSSRKIDPNLNAASESLPLANTRTPAHSRHPRGRPRDRGDTPAHPRSLRCTRTVSY